MIDPVDGMPCTICVGTDRYAAHVVKRLSPKRISVVYNYDKTDDDATVWSLRKDNRWRPKGASRRSGMRLVLDVAEDYLDPSF
jgi:hypothetical protein